MVKFSYKVTAGCYPNQRPYRQGRKLHWALERQGVYVCERKTNFNTNMGKEGS